MAQNTTSATAAPVPVSSQRFTWWVQAIVFLGALLSGAGAVIAMTHPAMLVSPGAEINDAAKVFAGYFAARNLVLACLLLALLLGRAKRALSQLLALVGSIQILDAAIDCAEARWPVVPGVLVLGILFLSAARKLGGHPFWNPKAWMENQS
jgi:hypothetical protein